MDGCLRCTRPVSILFLLQLSQSDQAAADRARDAARTYLFCTVQKGRTRGLDLPVPVPVCSSQSPFAVAVAVANAVANAVAGALIQ